MFSKEYNIMKLRSRIALLPSRGRENQSIVKKLKRRLRALESARA